MNAFIEKCLKEHEEENLDSRTSWENVKSLDPNGVHGIWQEKIWAHLVIFSIIYLDFSYIYLSLSFSVKFLIALARLN